MADPISIAAILALMYTGRKLSSEAPKPVQQPIPASQPKVGTLDSLSRVTNFYREPGYLGVQSNKKQETPSFGQLAQTTGKEPFGQRNVDMTSRMYTSDVMNNLSSTEKVLVGRGLGLDPSVPASGGFQQLFRVNPNNVGAYRLTTLPGRIAPGGDTTGYRRGNVGELTHFAPAKTAFMHSRRPEVRGRAQGQGGPVTGQTITESYERTKRPTNRAETSLRTDGLQYAPAKRFVSGSTSQDEPSRNKNDITDSTFFHTDNPQPGIHSYAPGYLNEPIVQYMNSSKTGDITSIGVRADDKRGNAGRAGNAGRMNVRENPLNQSGMLTSTRFDTSCNDGYIGITDGTRGQVYAEQGYSKFNSYKIDQDTTPDLTLAKRQMLNNPYAHPIS